ncbi:MAG: DEAD/DEAH box helicase [Candidatus Limnocylindrales bacterium]
MSSIVISPRCWARTRRSATASARPIEAVARDGSRALVVQRTGWGKSLVYWIATRVRRDEGHGPTLIISPLLALMRNQIAMADRLGLRAATINSGNTDEWDAVQHGLAANAIDVLLISPERLANDRFATDILPQIQGSIGLLVVDEAALHLRLGPRFPPGLPSDRRILRLLDVRVPVLATTATANDRVVADVVDQLGAGVQVFRGPLGRESLRLDAITLSSQAERLAWLAGQLPQLPGSGIVYCLTVADTQRVATFLRGQGIDARPYNAELSTQERGGPRGRPDRGRDEGPRRDRGAWHGLRQAGPRVRDPLPATELGDRVLPAGRARRSGGGAGLRRPAGRTRG